MNAVKEITDPKNRLDVQEMIDAGQTGDLHDSEFVRMREEMGSRVIIRRHELEMTQDELSKKTGLGLSTLRNIERGRNSPHLETILILCEALKTSSDYLLGLRNRNYDDMMQDAKTAHLIRMFFRFENKYKEMVLEFIKFIDERLIPKNMI